METKRYLTHRIPMSRGLFWVRHLLPTPGNILFTLLMLGGLVWAQSAGAFPGHNPQSISSTNTIAYQGRLADASGNPLTGSYPMAFSLYNTATGGAPVWQEQWNGTNSVQVTNGLFNVMLGSVTDLKIASRQAQKSLSELPL